MLANASPNVLRSGSLSLDLHLPATSLLEMLNFIVYELPRWRNRKDLKKVVSETALTSQLCAHLNSAARVSGGWDFLQFRVEEADENNPGRKIDLVTSPCGCTLWIEGKRHIDADTLLPIECKRLPTPVGKNRDEREYVISRHSTTGGIYRFKQGHHGSNHQLCAMIAYVQSETRLEWISRVTSWIQELIDGGQKGWTIHDLLEVTLDEDSHRLTILRSKHSRPDGLTDLEMMHYWIEIDPF